ncbi:hypothetical protein N7517_004002 [Penicillium concentricum]|uniref:GPI anchored cell wall protein n=1 Tax=Penicillium concentricum TaxID=293559 RepID=A0A9W9VA97_9EURO|nr:uncharacterized protein N7517_004002 [Penicillium concentricum]KAJ5371996.1 hypothetical protein N7517_004002 [Penicillium concentricum]
MRFYTIALLTGATAVAANSATLLLPGFAGQDLKASIVDTNGDATTYKITCSKTADACGIVGEGMTAIAAPTSMQLMNIDLQGTIGTVSCNIAGTTYASCQASAGTATPTGTLGPDDLNWMPVTISTTHTPTSTTTSTKAPTSTTSITTTEVTSTTTPAITSTSTLVTSTPKKSSSLIVSATASSTPLVAAPTNSAVIGTGAPASSSTPFNAAGQLAGSIWTVGGAFMALACVFA